MRTYAFIFARGGSKGLPRKNIKELAGKPLISYSIETACSIKDIDRVFVSTEDRDIANVAKQFDAEIIHRPLDLAQDNSPEWLAWRHAINHVITKYGKFDRFVSLPATAPLRAKSDVIACLDSLDEGVDIVITMQESKRSPWFNTAKMDENGFLSLLIESNYIRRQDAPEAFDITTVAYVTTPHFILMNNKIWDGRVRGVLIPEERAVDIDNQFDFKIAEMLMLEQVGKNA